MVLQDDLNRVEQLVTNSKLVLSQSKTKSMLFGTKSKLESVENFTIQLQGRNIEKVTNFNYLGVMLDEHLIWKEHVDVILIMQ